MERIAIVGAGAAGAAVAYALDGLADVTVLEKSGGVCGRAATRRRDDIVYDYGANYVTAADDRVNALLTEELPTEGLVEIDDPIWTFDAAGRVEPGRDDDGRKWTYRRGLTQLAKRLFDATNATVHRRTRVERFARRDNAWMLADSDGREWGPFDRLALNPPAPQTAALLRRADWETDVREELADALEAIAYRTIWTGIFHYQFELDCPYYALVNTDKAHEIGWIAREECKPGHVPAGQSLLVVQANHEWSIDHYDAPPAATLDDLAGLTAELLDDDRLAEPNWTDHQGWRYALPEDEPPADLLREPEPDGLSFVGDWVAGEARLHAALHNGLETGDRIADSL